MAASTGPDINTYQIDDVELGDTFNVWRDTTNTQTYKLNKMRIYSGVSSDTIDLGISASGVFTADIRTNVNKGLTFLQPVNFSSGVTFNGPVTFNADTFTVNASIVTIDDYAIVLGNTAAGSNDSKITAAGGGGLLIDRSGSGATASWLWKPDSIRGNTGAWYSNSNIAFSDTNHGVVPQGNGLLRVHGSGVFVDGGSTSEHGLQIKSTTTYGTTEDRTFEFSRYSPAGTTAFIEVFSGTTYGNRPFVSIKDGANRKTITTATAHGLQFGMPVRYSGTAYVKAQASDGSAAEVVGIVSAVYSSTQFEITFLGEIFGDFSVVNGGQPLIPGSTYYLSPYTAGHITSVQPTGSGLVHKAVLVATSTTSAIVLPFTGGVLSSPISIVNASSVSTTIPQYNGFTLGDMVRFKYYQNGITLYYKNDAPAGASSSQYHQYGIFVKAQANSEEEAEVAGMVVGRSGLTGTAPYTFYTSFDVLMDGFFDLSTSALSLQPGTVYFLNTGSAGSSNSFESAVVTHNTAFPTQLGQVRKPLFMATGPKSGYLFSYRGDIRAEVGITGASADITRFLVKDIRDGISGDLVVGVYNAANNGRESIRIAAGTQYFNQTVGLTGGLVGIGGGWSPYATSVAGQPSRIMAQLDVNGELRLGKTLDSSTPRGQDLIIVRDVSDNANGVTMDSRVVIGTEYSSTNLVIGRGVRPARTAAGYISSLGGVQDRSALVVGVSGADPMLRWGIAENSSAALGTGVVLRDVFSVVGITSSFYGPITTNSPVRISSTGVYPTATSTLAYNRVLIGGTAPNLLIWNDGQAAAAGLYSQLGLGVKSSANPLMLAGGFVHGGNENTSDSSGFLAFNTTPTDGSSNRERMRIDSNGNVGIGTATPSVSLDVAGTIRASSGIRFGTDTSTANTLSDYEEGSYTATVQYSTTLTNTNPITTTTITAYYVKVGKLVTVFTPQITRDGTFGGTDVIVNTISLPFASGNYNEIGTVGGYRVRGQYSTNIAEYGEYMFAYTSGSLGIVRMLSKTALGDSYYPRLDRVNSAIQMTMTYRTA